MKPKDLIFILQRLLSENLHGPTSFVKNSKASSGIRSSFEADWQMVQDTEDLDAKDPVGFTTHI